MKKNKTEQMHKVLQQNTNTYKYGIQGGSVSDNAWRYARKDDELSISWQNSCNACKNNKSSLEQTERGKSEDCDPQLCF